MGNINLLNYLHNYSFSPWQTCPYHLLASAAWLCSSFLILPELLIVVALGEDILEFTE